MRQDILFGESLDSVIYIAVTCHSWFAKSCTWLPIGNIDDEVQAASGYCISFVYKDYGHPLSSTLRIMDRVQPMSFSQLSTYHYLQLLLDTTLCDLATDCCNLVRECGACVTYWCMLKAISWRYGVCRSVYLWDNWWGGILIFMLCLIWIGNLMGAPYQHYKVVEHLVRATIQWSEQGVNDISLVPFVLLQAVYSYYRMPMSQTFLFQKAINQDNHSLCVWSCSLVIIILFIVDAPVMGWLDDGHQRASAAIGQCWITTMTQQQWTTWWL